MPRIGAWRPRRRMKGARCRVCRRRLPLALHGQHAAECKQDKDKRGKEAA